MGLGGISIWNLLIILLIVVLLFGTKRLKGMGSDLGETVKGFRKALKDDSAPADSPPANSNNGSDTQPSPDERNG